MLGKKHKDWWSYTKSVIRSYPVLKRKLESIGNLSIIAAYGNSAGHTNMINKPVEYAVLNKLTDKEQRRYDAITAAIQETKHTSKGNERLTLIKLVYWDKSHTLYGAALCVAVSEATAKRWNSQFIRLVEKYLALSLRLAAAGWGI